jgi:hypothetical protein
MKALNGPVFSAESADDEWSGWGGPIPERGYEVVAPVPEGSDQ